MSEFVHLHLHSEYSLLESSLRIRDIPALCEANGQTAVAITDRGAMYGCVAFWRACTEKGIKPVLGCELGVYEDVNRPKKPHTLVLLCENETGYKNLMYLVSASFTGSGGAVPCVEISLLKSHSAGLIALSGGTDGRINAELAAGEHRNAELLCRIYAEIFGAGSFFIELQNHGTSEERLLLPELYALARECGVGVVATNDVKYAKRSDSYSACILDCIKNGRLYTPGDELPGDYYYKSPDEMERLFGGFTGAIENTVKIAERCSFSYEFGKYRLPVFPLPAGVSSADALASLASDGFERLLSEGRIPAPGHTPEEYAQRLSYELSVIGKMGFNDYFLTVSDYVGHARKTGISVGPGRGSGCGSLVALCTGITDVDPLKYGLLFERFLNPERVSMPDIDIDFDYTRRGELIDYVKEKYGPERVTQIITFGTLAARAAVRDAARVLGTDKGTADLLVSLLGDSSLAEAWDNAKIKKLCAESRDAGKLYETASAIEGLPRNISVHAAGVVIAPVPVYELVPLSVSGDTVITQFDMTTVEQLGLLKFDFLALRYLTVIDGTVRMIKRKNPDFSIEDLSTDDPETYSLLTNGDATGVFQLDTPGMRRVVRGLKPTGIDGIMAAIALYRPGPMESIPKYIERGNNPALIKYAHPLLEPILKETRGCIVYQEQVMNIFRTLAGYTAGHADIVRRAMSKKKAEALEAERGCFVNGAVSKGMSADGAGALFDEMTAFAGYAFNKSHAAAYALLTFRTAYLKAHYPAQFMASLMNEELGSGKTGEYITRCTRSGIAVLPPNINRSGAFFSASDGEITCGLTMIKGVGSSFALSAESLRPEGGYSSVEALVNALPGADCSRRTLEALIRAGALDCINTNRALLLYMLDSALEGRENRSKSNPEGQLDMFSAPGADAALPGKKLPDLPDFSPGEKSSAEYGLMGISFSSARERQRQASNVQPAQNRPAQAPAFPRASVVYVRVPSRDSDVYRRAENIAGIFEGNVRLSFYFSDTGKYEKNPTGLAWSPYVKAELEGIAGADSVVAR